MMADHWLKAQDEAAKRVETHLSLAMPPSDMVGSDGYFAPWDLFSGVYGCYDEDFDTMAIEVLEGVLAGNHRRRDLASEMFREMLCVENYCEYGTSPRSCFPTMGFKEHLPDLIEKWKAYHLLQWHEPC